MNVWASLIYLVLCASLSCVVVRRLVAPDDRADRVLVCLTIITVLAATFFGGFHLLGLVELITSRPIVRPVNAAALAGAVLAGSALWRRGTQPAGREASRASVVHPDQPASGLSRAILIAAIVVLTGVAIMLAADFPVGYEARAYHLPIALHVFQTGSLKVWDVVFPLTLTANASIYYGFLLGLLPERLVSAANMLFMVPLGVAVYGLGRVTGADKTASLFAAVGMLTIPLVDFGGTVAEADTGGAAFLAMAIYFAAAPGHRRLTYRALSGLSAGLAFGFKLFHVVTIVLLCALIVVESAITSRSDSANDRLRTGGLAVAVLLGSAFATAGFWLIRNYVQLGNPFYPWHLPVFDRFGWIKPFDLPDTIFAAAEYEWVRAPREWFLYPWVEASRPVRLFGSHTGLGPFFAAAVPVACLASLVGIVKRGTTARGTLAVLLGGGVLVLLAWASGPRQPRYAMGAFVFLVPLVAWTVSQLDRRPRRVFEYVLAFCICCMLLVILSVQFVGFARSLVQSRSLASRSQAYGYPRMLDRLPPGSTVVNAGGRVWNYALFGEGHRNQVVTFEEAVRVLSNVTPLCYYPPDMCTPFPLTMDASALRRLGATYVFTIGGNKGIALHGCVRLKEVDRLDDAFMKRTLSLYQVVDCDDHQGS